MGREREGGGDRERERGWCEVMDSHLKCGEIYIRLYILLEKEREGVCERESFGYPLV